MKKNILTAIIALILSISLFFTLSIKNVTAITDKTINSTILEINIPSKKVVKKVIPLLETTTEGIVEESTEIFYEVKYIAYEPTESIIEEESCEIIENVVEEITSEIVETSIKEEVCGTVESTTEIETTIKTTFNEISTTIEETTTPIIIETTTEIEEIDYEEELWQKRKSEYPVASYIWLYMKELGWNDYVCAGIMGNIMAEVGGQTLNIEPYLYSGQYYGICQWYLPYTDGTLSGASLEYQCEYLKNTIEKEFNIFGYKYSSSMNYLNFLNLSSPSEAALCFAKCYERCASFSYNIRQTNAQKAYTYFVG